MRNCIQVEKKITYESIEKLLKTINEVEVDIDLEIPLKLNYKGFGYLPSFLLALFSWMRNKTGKIIIDLEPDNKNAIEEFVLDYYGYTIISTVWKDFEIINKNGVSLKGAFSPYTRAMHDRIDLLDQSLPNDSVLIPCFDHYSKEKGLSHWFYFSNYEFAKSPSQLETSIFRIVESLKRIYWSRFNKNTIDLFDNLLEIIWELMRNTNEHATKDYLNESKLMPNCRGLFMKIHRGSKNNLIEFNNHKGLADYYKSIFKNEPQPFMLEISVFDSGPGLVKRFLGKDWSADIELSDDIETVKKCLIKGQTSISNLDSLNKGYGLDEVLKLLDKKSGFLKIRTGRVSVYRDLKSSPYKKTQAPSEVELYDWESLKNDKFLERNYTEGTLITLAYPLLLNEQK